MNGDDKQEVMTRGKRDIKKQQCSDEQSDRRAAKMVGVRNGYADDVLLIDGPDGCIDSGADDHWRFERFCFICMAV
jgi:hypothetical protein